MFNYILNRIIYQCMKNDNKSVLLNNSSFNYSKSVERFNWFISHLKKDKSFKVKTFKKYDL